MRRCDRAGYGGMAVGWRVVYRALAVIVPAGIVPLSIPLCRRLPANLIAQARPCCTVGPAVRAAAVCCVCMLPRYCACVSSVVLCARSPPAAHVLLLAVMSALGRTLMHVPVISPGTRAQASSRLPRTLHTCLLTAPPPPPGLLPLLRRTPSRLQTLPRHRFRHGSCSGC